MTRRIAVLTTGRQDWGMLRPLCEELHSDPSFDLFVVAGGMACDRRYCNVAEEIEKSGLPLSYRMEWDVEKEPAIQASNAIEQISRALDETKPEAIVLLGDRYETCAGAFSATLKRVPIVHLYGGEETEGAFDNAFRHAISKMSHLHFAANEVYARRLIAMGENPEAVHVVGLLSLDIAAQHKLPDRHDLESSLGIKLEPPIFLVTLHPATLGDSPDVEFSALAGAMKAFTGTWIVTLPNADPGGVDIRKYWEKVKGEIQDLHCYSALGEDRYLGLMKLAAVVIGNSSSGLTEAPFFRVPSVNIGDRQKGRLRSISVIDARPLAEEIINAIRKARDPIFMGSIIDMKPAYGQGNASKLISTTLKNWKIPRDCRKPFYEAPDERS